MYRDFHYYGTYLAARLAGYDKLDAEIIAYAAQYVDDSNQGRRLSMGEYGIDFQPIPTVQSFPDIAVANIYKTRQVWVPFHFLPGNISGTESYNGDDKNSAFLRDWSYDDKAKREFKLMCLPNSDLARDMINDIVDQHLKDPYLLELIGLRMHVLADTVAHQYFAGVPAWHINDTAHDVKDCINNCNVPYGLGANDEFCSPGMMISGNSVYYLGHARMGSILDYPWLEFIYEPRWTSNNSVTPRQIVRNNPAAYLTSFLQIYTALKRIRDCKHFDFDHLEPLKKEYISAIGNILKIPHEYGSKFINDDGHSTERSQHWIVAIDGKVFGNIEKPTPYDENAWLNEIMSGEKQYPPNPISITRYYKFNQAVIVHRDFVNLQLYKSYIDLNTEDLSYTLNPAPSWKAVDVIVSLKTDGLVKSSPAIIDDVVYVGCETGKVYAFDLQKLTEIWHYTTGGSVTSSPAVAHGILCVGSADGNVHALDAATGALIWKFETKGPVICSPTISGDIVYIGSDDHNLYALKLKNGEQIWVYSTGGLVRSKPEIAQGNVYIGSTDCYAYAIKAANGEEKWKQWVGRPVQGSLTYSDGLVFAAAGEVAFGAPHQDLQAMDYDTSEIRWAIAFIDSDAFYSKPIVYGDNVIIRSMYLLEAYNKYTGNLVKTIDVFKNNNPLDIQSSPVIADGLLYVVLDDRQSFKIYDAKTFNLLWETDIGHSHSTPALSDGVIAVGSDDNRLTILGNSQAKFTASPIFGAPPLTVQFTDKSLFVPESWEWIFDEYNRSQVKSNLQNPVHIYNEPGIYSVILTARSNRWGKTTVMENMIYVLEPSNIKMGGDITPLSRRPDQTDYEAIGGSSATRQQGTIVDTFLGKNISLPAGRRWIQLTNMAALGDDGCIYQWSESDPMLKVYSPGTDREYVAISSWGDWVLAIARQISTGETSLAVLGDDALKALFPEVFNNIPGGTGWAKIAAGFNHALALRNDGVLTSWGNNDNGQLELVNGSTAYTKFLDVAAGYKFSLGLFENTKFIIGAGKDDFGQIKGIPQNNNTIVSLVAGLNTAAGLTSDGRIVTWGAPLEGLPVPTDAGYTQICLGTATNYLLAIKATKKIAP